MITRRKTLDLDGTPQPDDGPVPSNSWRRCGAWGCPLAGVWSDSAVADPNKETKWQCSVHMVLDPSQWQTATGILKETQRVAQLEQALAEIGRTGEQTLYRAFIREVISEARILGAGQQRLTARASPQEHMKLAKELLTKDLPPLRQPGEDDA